jgi:carbon-monoxide dehydrogenase medium subunit
MLHAASKRRIIVNRYDYHKPGTIEEAVGLMTTLDEAKYIAGGTDVMVLIRQKKLKPKNLISIRNIKGLAYIDATEGLMLGASTTHNDIANHDVIRQAYSALADASGAVGSQQIRNVATVGGNICNAAPSADTACPLLIFDARVLIKGKKSTREMPLDKFIAGPNKVILEPGELVTGFAMPSFGKITGSVYIKFARRQAMDLPILGLAARTTISITGNETRCKEAFKKGDGISQILKILEEEGLAFKDVRIAMCVMAPRPIRAKKAEETLKGKTISSEILKQAAEMVESESQPRDSFRGEAWYRRHMVKVLTNRALIQSIYRALA